MNAPLGFASYLVDPSRPLVVREEAPCAYGAAPADDADDGAADDEGDASADADAAADPDPREVTAWAAVHRRLVGLGQRRAAIERQLCRWLVAAERLEVPKRLGMASLSEYADRHLGLSGRQTEERLRVGRALPELPALDEAFATGTLCFSQVRELSRVATAETERAWVDWACSHGARETERAVASREPGQLPTDAGDPSRLKHRLSFEVKAETLALFRDLRAAVEADLGHRVDDDTLLLEVARRALGGGGREQDESRAPYQVAVSRCDRCQQASIDAGGERHSVDAAVAEMVACDAQDVGEVDATVAEADAAEHVGEVDGPHLGATSSPKRATQTIPPATRRKVLRRDGKRCRVPGCRHHRFLDLHHVRPRSEGGSHDPEQLTVLCGAHHRAVHAGTLVIEGAASAGFSFRHADGTAYGAPASPEAADVAAQVFRGLVHLGFKQTEARARIAKVQSQGAPDDVAAFLRCALQLE